MDKKKAMMTFRVHGLNKDNLKDNVKVPAYTERQARWKAKYLYKFRLVTDVLTIK